MEQAYTMSAARYQCLIGVHQPWIAEISPWQYANMSGRARAQYDKKREKEWSDSIAAKREWRDKVIAAYETGKITIVSPELHPEAKEAIREFERFKARKAAEEAMANARRANRITSADQIAVGDRVFDIMTGHYGTITKKSRLSVRLQVENPPAWLAAPIKVGIGQLQWKRGDDVTAQG